MYTLTLILHSWLRWAVLVLGLLVVVRSFAASRSRRSFEPADSRLGLFFTIAMDLQLVLGLALYVALSPTTHIALSNMRLAMRVRELRFWAVEHSTLMVLAVVFAHVGRIRARRSNDDRARHSRMATWTLLAVLAVLAAIPWPMLAVGRPLVRLH